MGLIEHAYEQRQLFRALIGRRSGYAVQQRFREMVFRLVSDGLPATSGKLPQEAAARWLSAAFFELLSWWIEQHTPMPPTELAALFIELAQPVRLTPALHPASPP
ncbi:MAG: TetR family transcriptional regulator C-terminal domain-containing protein [Rhodoferax sp.]|nr:TetR family transcriptional regulator C-terminal domain-containing protein [Rhodoferax sp.]